MLKIYAYKSCDTCRKGLQWLDANKIKYEVVPIRDQPPTEAELRVMLTAHDGQIRKLFNTSGQDYKSLNLKDKLPLLSDAEAIQLLSKNGNLVKRPFVIGKNVALVGYDEAHWNSNIPR